MLTGLYARFQELQSASERGAAAVEYGLLVALIAVVIIVAVTALGLNLESIFDEVKDAIGG